jgi:hypothetical protein
MRNITKDADPDDCLKVKARGEQRLKTFTEADCMVRRGRGLIKRVRTR